LAYHYKYPIVSTQTR